jgi:hypothetical protein
MGIITAYLISLPFEWGKMEDLAFRGKHCKQKHSYFNGGTNVSKSRFCVVYCALVGFPDDWLGISWVGISHANSPAAARYGMDDLRHNWYSRGNLELL